MIEMNTGRVEVGNARLAYTEAGEGDPVVFIHAGIADRRMWEPQVPAFAEHFRTVTFDMRGFGASEMVDEPFSHRADLAGLLDALAIQRTHLVACSMGAAVALAFAIEYPEFPRSLVLVNSAAPGFVPEGGYFEPPQWEESVAAFKAGDFARAAQLEVEMWVAGPYRQPDEISPEVRDLVQSMDTIALRSESSRDEYAQHLDPSAGSRLDEIACPALVIVSELDMPDMTPLGEHLAGGIADARLVSFPDAAHLPNLERPGEFNRIVLDFLAEVGS